MDELVLPCGAVGSGLIVPAARLLPKRDDGKGRARGREALPDDSRMTPAEKWDAAIFWGLSTVGTFLLALDFALSRQAG